jgi:hypothetical protein
MGAHVLAHVLRVPRLASADSGRDDLLPGSSLRRWLLAGSLVAGLVIAVATLCISPDRGTTSSSSTDNAESGAGRTRLCTPLRPLRLGLAFHAREPFVVVGELLHVRERDSCP